MRVINGRLRVWDEKVVVVQEKYGDEIIIHPLKDGDRIEINEPYYINKNFVVGQPYNVTKAADIFPAELDVSLSYLTENQVRITLYAK